MQCIYQAAKALKNGAFGAKWLFIAQKSMDCLMKCFK
jgi:hypothetical protein